LRVVACAKALRATTLNPPIFFALRGARGIGPLPRGHKNGGDESMLGQLKITWTDMSSYYKYRSLKFKNNVKEVKLDEDIEIQILNENHVAIIDAYRDDVLIISSKDVPLGEFPLHLLKYLEKTKTVLRKEEGK